MRRKMMKQLIRWRSSKTRKPLILEGARQVGKTYLLSEFGQKHYSNVLYINCENATTEFREMFNGSIYPGRILQALELLYNVEITKDTLIFFDEAQEIPRLITALKYFYEDEPNYHIVVSGSLIGLFLHAGTSFPVGKVEIMRLEPLDFEEFMWATGGRKIIESVKEIPRSTVFNERLKDEFRRYIAVGGMPEAVKTWVNSKEIAQVEQVQKNILANYLSDFSKHTSPDVTVRIRQIWDGLVSQFAKNNDKFVYGAIKSGARARDYELAIQWLVDSGVVRKVNKVLRGDKLPLKAYRDVASFKLYFIDIGLFRTLADIPTSVIMQKTAIFDEFNGLIAEQFVLQELASKKMYYWTGAKSEVDFITQISEHIVPIEVKSGENVKAKSLKVYREKYHPQIAVRFSLKELEFNEGLLNIPLHKSWLFSDMVEKRLDSPND